MEEERSFWIRTWKTIRPERISAYLEHADQTADPLIDYLKQRKITSVCDAGCGCGAYSLKLARQGFTVSGFDVAEDAVTLTKKLLSENGFSADTFFTTDILSTGYADGSFDAVVARDVIDHLPIRQGIAAVNELLRIVRPGGFVLLTLDGTDSEYESEPHERNADGDYLFTSGKWAGMAFHPVSLCEISKLTAGRKIQYLTAGPNSFAVVIEKQ